MAWGKKGRQKGNQNQPQCRHRRWHWSNWSYVEGVTAGIMWRVKMCDDTCKQMIDTEAKEV